MAKSTWIVFDVGGVLLHWEQSLAALARTLDVPHDLLLSTMFNYAPRMNVGIIAPQEGWRLILKDLGRDADYDPNEIIRMWRKRDFWLPDSLATVQALHDNGYHLAILTNSWLGLTDETDKDLLPEELRLFEHILDSSKEGIRKPDEAFYTLLEARTGSGGDAIFFIDDADKNLPPATAKGWQTFYFMTDESAASNQKLRELLLT